ncbi:hypothetical protein BAE44_0021309 [Dichanthelium oligosanthes]|uniref:PWWP domain-containing protein n=1 Tax=Dichanthelium oligosanthes TaxID=888268 RepID=A0A1E5UXS6_9POAL|nr:hypothetical protein BAE44_0021309 [Dichanthelium oligosanthes]
MAPSPVVVEGDAALHAAALSKNAAFGEGMSTVRRPGRLRVMHPHVAEFLRSPRRHGRPAKQPAPAQDAETERPRARYVCAFEDDEDGARGGGAGVAAPGRMVWGKVRHHPWWPGQVFDAADASGDALAHRRPRRAVLVAYFWDKSFAWNERATLRPFRAGFERLAAQSGMAPFAAAVETALDEVARRVEAGLSCCCGPGAGKGEATANRQVIDNAGVREGAYGAAVDAAFARGELRGEALVGYISALATAPLAGADWVDLTIATAQLKAFGRWRGSMRGLPEYTVVHGIGGVDVKAAPGRAKRRRSSTGGGNGDGSGKRRMSRSSANGDGGDYEALELEDFPQPAPQQMSTKIGKLMSRAAQQMSLSPVILRSNGDAPPSMPHMARCPRDKLPPMNSGDLNGDPTGGAVLVNERRPAAENEHHLEAGLVLNFSSANAVPSAVHLTMIFSRFGPVKEVRAENSSALVIFKKGKHAEEAFSATAKISSISSSLISFRLTYSLPTAPIDPPQSMLLDPLPAEALR